MAAAASRNGAVVPRAASVPGKGDNMPSFLSAGDPAEATVQQLASKAATAEVTALACTVTPYQGATIGSPGNYRPLLGRSLVICTCCYETAGVHALLSMQCLPEASVHSWAEIFPVLLLFRCVVALPNLLETWLHQGGNFFDMFSVMSWWQALPWNWRLVQRLLSVVALAQTRTSPCSCGTLPLAGILSWPSSFP